MCKSLVCSAALCHAASQEPLRVKSQEKPSSLDPQFWGTLFVQRASKTKDTLSMVQSSSAATMQAGGLSHQGEHAMRDIA
jgi:hypothetical protein